MRRRRRDRLAPRVGRRCDERARIGLVLVRLQHVGRQPVLAAHGGDLGGGLAGQRGRRRAQRVVVGVPARHVAGQRDRVGLGGGRPGRADRRRGAGAEPERQRERLPRGRVDLRGQRDVAIAGRLVLVRQPVAGVELAEPVAGRPGEPGRGGQERPAAGQRPVAGGRERARAGGRVGVGGDQRCGGRVDRGVVGARVGGSAAAGIVEVRVVAHVHLQVPEVRTAARQRHHPAAHDHAVASRVGQVVGHELEPVPCVGARHLAHHAAAVRGADRVGHVPFLQVGESFPVGDHELDGLDVRALDARVVDVGQHAASDREPHLGGRVAGGAEAILARLVQVGLGSGAAWRGPGHGR